MKKLITIIMLIAAITISTTSAQAETIPEPVRSANLALQNSDEINEAEDDALAPLWSFISETGKSIAGMWVSIIILIIFVTGFLIVYLRRKRYAVKYDEMIDK